MVFVVACGRKYRVQYDALCTIVRVHSRVHLHARMHHVGRVCASVFAYVCFDMYIAHVHTHCRRSECKTRTYIIADLTKLY